MKTFKILSLVVILSSVFASCTTKVTRLEPEKSIDLSGEWNDTDLRIVCDSLVKDASSSPYISRYSNENSRLPVVVVGSFRNDSDEHIDTSIISKNMETALLNSGKMDFVSTAEQRPEVRAEIKQQQNWVTAETRKVLAQETGADFIMLGSVKSMVDQISRKTVRTYYVYAELINLQTGKKIWMGKNNSIKKLITRPSVKF